MFDFSQLINDVIVWAGFIGLSKTPLIQFVAKNKGAIETAAKDIETVAHDVLQFPAVKTVEVKLKHELNDTMDKLKQSELARLAAEALNYTEKDLGQLSTDQKHALVLLIQTKLPKEFEFTKDAIEKALEVAQSNSDAISTNPLIVAADKFTQEVQQAIQAPAQQA